MGRSNKRTSIATRLRWSTLKYTHRKENQNMDYKTGPARRNKIHTILHLYAFSDVYLMTFVLLKNDIHIMVIWRQIGNF